MLRKEIERKIKPRDASKLKVGIVVSRYNDDITSSMLAGAQDVLRDWGVLAKNTHIAYTYGSFELPFAAQRLIKQYRLDAVVALGCIVKGETSHDVFLAHVTNDGLMRVMLDTGVPIGLGVLTTNNLAQARVRSRGTTNHGTKAAVAALESALLR